MLKSLTFAALAATLTLPAAAASWQVWEGNDAAAPRAIYSTGSEGPGVVLVCKAYGDLGAFLSLESGDVSKALTKSAPYARGADASLSINGETSIDTRLRYIPAVKIVESREHAIAARVFNAAVEGKPFAVTVKTGTGGPTTIDYTLPAPDEAFDAFAKRCEQARAEKN